MSGYGLEFRKSFIDWQNWGWDLLDLILSDKYVSSFAGVDKVKFFEWEILEVKDDMDKLEEFISNDL